MNYEEELLDADIEMQLIACEAYINNDIEAKELVDTYFKGNTIEALIRIKELVNQK